MWASDRGSEGKDRSFIHSFTHTTVNESWQGDGRLGGYQRSINLNLDPCLQALAHILTVPTSLLSHASFPSHAIQGNLLWWAALLYSLFALFDTQGKISVFLFLTCNVWLESKSFQSKAVCTWSLHRDHTVCIKLAFITASWFRQWWWYVYTCHVYQ